MTNAFLRSYGIPLVLCGIALASELLGTSATQLLRFQRDAVIEGELWRLLTGHLVHLGWSHLTMNLLGLVVVWSLAGHYLSVGRWNIALLICALGTSLGLLLFNPGLAWYVGLSGLLHSVLVIGAVLGVCERERSAVLLLVFVVAKLLWEQLQGAMPGSAEMAGGPVVVDAHLYGALAGLGMAMILVRHRS